MNPVELKRQLFHIFFGILILLLVLFVQHKTVLIILLALLIIAIIIAIISVKIRILPVRWLLGAMGRETDEKFPGKGFIFFLAGCLLVLKIFSQDIALASIAVLTFGDSVSTLVGCLKGDLGKKYNSSLFNRYKAVYGTLIGIVVSFPIAMLFISPLYALVASVIGMLAEAISIKLGEQEADDNLIVPLAAGTACYLLRLIL
jgi:dolichol kinase